MAKGKRNFLSGKIGNLIFYERDNEQIVRGRPAKYRDAKTKKQKTARRKFLAAVKFYGHLNLCVLLPAWRTAAAGSIRCGLNLFISKNLHAFGENDEVADYERLHLSMGSLLQPSRMEHEIADARTLRLSWSVDLLSDREQLTDELLAAVAYPMNPKWTWVIEGLHATRGDGGAVIHVPPAIRSEAHVYCFFRSRERTLYSDDWHFRLPATGDWKIEEEEWPHGLGL